MRISSLHLHPAGAAAAVPVRRPRPSSMTYRAAAAAFDLALRSTWDLHVEGLDNFTASPCTLVVTNHRRDADVPIVATALLRRMQSGMYFVAREDLFRRGFLGGYLGGWPSLLREPFYWLDLSPLVRFFGARPMRRVPERTLGEVLSDLHSIFGDLPLEQVLEPRWVERFRELSGRRPPRSVRDALGRRYRPLRGERLGLTKLAPQMFAVMAPYERWTIETHLREFVGLLEDGETLLLAPEGVLSQDGRCARFRGALHALINRPRVTPRVLPISITYDFMTNGRPTAFVGVGSEMRDLRGQPRRAADARVADAILAGMTVTASQLASQVVSEAWRSRQRAVTRAQLIRETAQRAQAHAAAGRRVDPRLLRAPSLVQRIDQYLQHCIDQSVLAPRAEGRYVPTPRELARHADGSNRSTVEYAVNELSSFAEPLCASPEGRAA